jgi:hypothetical protein
MAEESRFSSQDYQEIAIFSMVFRLALGPTQPPVCWILVALSLGRGWEEIKS